MAAPTGRPEGTEAVAVRVDPAAAARLLFGVLLFVSYPLALVIPVRFGISLVFHIAVPTFLLFSLFCIGYLLTVSPGKIGDARPSPAPSDRSLDLARVAGGLLAAYAAIVLVSATSGHTARFEDVFLALGAVCAPAFFALCPRRWLPKNLTALLAGLWLAQAVHGILQLSRGHEPVLLAGNRNWAATLVAVLTPWACLAVRSCRRRWQFRWVRWAEPLAHAGIILLTLVFLLRAECRATWLVLGAYVLFFVLFRPLSRGARAAICAVLAAFAVAVLIMFPTKVGKTIESDIRVPLYASTVRLIADRPWLGVGPGNFRREFVLYRSDAHKARAVAASVTEHPHNELLHVCATLGIPAGLIWLLVMGVPLLLSPGRCAGMRAAHFGAWMLVGHGMLDKVLVQPPTNLLAVLFVGMLWRRHLHLRAQPASAPVWLTRTRVPVALILTVMGIYALSQDVRRGILFRRAYLAEAEGRNRNAYDAYNESTFVDPRNVRTHAFAGICANNRLKDPTLALPHLERAMQLERDFAHLNGEVGLALGNLKRHKDALPFFVREVQLYPFSVHAYQRLFLCGAVTGAVPDLDALHTRILELQWRQARISLGDARTAELAGECLLALKTNRGIDAVRDAAALIKPAEAEGAEPPYYRLMPDREAADAVLDAGFGLLDLSYLTELLRLQSALAPRTDRSPESLLKLAETLVPESRTPERLRALTQLARLSGYGVASIQAGGSAEGTNTLLELSLAGQTWLLDTKSGLLTPDATAVDLLVDKTLRQRHGVPDITSLHLRIPVNPLRFLGRIRALSAILSQYHGRQAPNCAASPTVSLINVSARVQKELAAADLTATPPPVTVDFDPQPFVELVEWIRRRAARDRSAR
jgi:O-antigen ligase